jgi:hypothetical protein
MAKVWSGKAPKNCRNCGAKIGEVFYDGRMAACEGFTMGQFCERCFKDSSMLGRAEGVRYSKNETGTFVSD